MEKVLIIAEAGVNHNGSLDIAKQLILKAAEAKADFVKFQTFIPEKNLSPHAKTAKYQRKNTGKVETQIEMVRSLQLSKKDHLKLKAFCESNNIGLVSTAFDPDSLDLLLELDVPFLKCPSGDITNYPLLKKMASAGKPVYLSTGMATMEEVETAYSILNRSGQEITVMHCNTEYPTPMEDVNLKAMITMGKKLNVPVGYSDHTLGIEVPIAAVALGATVIEKHFTLDRDMEGPDHRASLEPEELKDMVIAIRNIEKAISGSGKKEPSPSEQKNKEVARKSIHTTRSLKRGEIITEEDLIALRPGDGISPMEWTKVIGMRVVSKMDKFEKITRDKINFYE